MNCFKYYIFLYKHFHQASIHGDTNIIPASNPHISHRKDATTTLAGPNIFWSHDLFLYFLLVIYPELFIDLCCTVVIVIFD